LDENVHSLLLDVSRADELVEERDGLGEDFKDLVINSGIKC